MSDIHVSPPRWASALLRWLLRPADSEAIPGDLLEEYRDVKYPSLGRRGADAWYAAQVFSLLWRVMWPCVAAMLAIRILSFSIPRGWNPSLASAPGVSMLDGLLLLWTGYYGSHRTGRLSTGIVLSSVMSVLGFTMLFVYAVVTTPGLLVAPFEKPFIFVIMATLLGMALGLGMAVGIAGAAVGRWLPPGRWRTRAS